MFPTGVSLLQVPLQILQPGRVPCDSSPCALVESGVGQGVEEGAFQLQLLDDVRHLFELALLLERELAGTDRRSPRLRLLR